MGDSSCVVQLAILNAASIFGRVIPGYFAPKLGSLNMSVFFMVANGVVTACMPVVKGSAGVIVYTIFYGLISGGCT